MNKIFTSVLILSHVIGLYTIFPAANLLAKTQETNPAAEQALKVKKNGIETKEATAVDHRFIDEKEKRLLARLVHAEAKGEPFEGKVAVAEVVLNRVEHEQFPDTVKEVIYQKNAFEPVQNGSISDPPSQEAVKAVEKALTKPDTEKELLYFYNPKTATSDWIFTRKVVKKIGRHSFAI